MLRDAQGAEHRISEDLEVFDLGAASDLLQSAKLRIELPPDWIFRRDLPPISKDSLKYLDAFVRHQIERMSPWRPEDIFFAVRTGSLAGDIARLSVSIAIVPKRKLRALLHALASCNLESLELDLGTGRADESLSVLIGDRAQDQQSRMRLLVMRGLAAAVCLFLAAFAFLSWETARVTSENEALDAAILARRKILFSGSGTAAAGNPVDEWRASRLRQMRRVETIDRLSAILPDQAYLSDLEINGERLRISGQTSGSADLIPMLEQSGAFVDVTASAATTRSDNDTADRFHLEMGIVNRQEKSR